MCFSPAADAVAGTVVLGLGAVALASQPERRERALAALPVLFGAHLLVEVPVWWSVQGRAAEATGRLAGGIYLAIAMVAVPALVPLALLLAEPTAGRRRLVPFAALGATTAAVLGWALVVDPFTVRARGHHLDYQLAAAPPTWVVLAYLAATVGTALASIRPTIRAFGATNAVVVLLLVVVERTALVSLWCAWAAITSAVLVAHLRRRPSRSGDAGSLTCRQMPA